MLFRKVSQRIYNYKRQLYLSYVLKDSNQTTTMNNITPSQQVIEDFFSAFSLHQALQLLDKLLFTACSAPSWPGRFPADAVYFCERIAGLSDAVFAISNEPPVSGTRLQKKKENEVWQLTRYETYCGRHKNSTPWHFFPRSLSQKEFCNPYKAFAGFTRCCTRERWKDILNELLHCALSPHTMQEQDETPGLLIIRLYLHKLIEAAHLFAVRIHSTDADELLPGSHV